MRTYMAYYDSERKTDMLTYQTIVMFCLLTDGPSANLDTLQNSLDSLTDSSWPRNYAQTRATLSKAAYVCKQKGWLTRNSYGIYTLTQKGRQVWEPLLDKQLA